jgi:hypothetical protein
VSRLLAGIALAVFAPIASAAISCSVTMTAVLVVYDPTSAVQNVTTGSYSVSCSRALADPNTQTWSLGVDNGLQPAAGFNRVQSAANKRYQYDTYRISPYIAANLWGDTATTRFTGTLNFGSSLTASASGAFDIVMNAGQAVQPAGIYSDTLTATLRNGAATTTFNTTAFGVSVHTDNWCQISVAPGTVAFAYTSFQNTVANASTTYGVRCTTALPYSMSLDLTSSTLLGLTYNLSLSPASSSGTGATQTHQINGTIAAGQGGTCASSSCTGTQTRTLTLSW